MHQGCSQYAERSNIHSSVFHKSMPVKCVNDTLSVAIFAVAPKQKRLSSSSY